MTVLYLPLLDFFLSVLNCVKDENGQNVHFIFKEVVCYQGEHLVHSILAVLVIAAFILISQIVGIAYFECRTNNDGPDNRLLSILKFLKYINKELMQEQVTPTIFAK